jgi:hypothetical protein
MSYEFIPIVRIRPGLEFTFSHTGDFIPRARQTLHLRDMQVAPWSSVNA